MNLQLRIILISILLVSSAGCTTGKLEYLTSGGELKTACETEYSWMPSVDKYAVEYKLAYCAKKAVAQGYTVVEKRLLSLDLTIPKAPGERDWNFELAGQEFDLGNLTNKEYGYIIAYIDLQRDIKSTQN
ncbi:MAG: hypothetical protein OQJ89_14470 [Kangiellaceae bacterium]|nr:hypothetical protein [Kangiellaceae bacterium]MCW9018171.1 hypothetical protein [Kangiellaceae bacterium]